MKMVMCHEYHLLNLFRGGAQAFAEEKEQHCVIKEAAGCCFAGEPGRKEKKGCNDK